jgi:hypothetical protein
MNRASPQMRNLAKHLIVSEVLGNNSSEVESLKVFHITDQMRPHLTVLMGTGGFRALLSRALTLAKSEASWLSAVRVNSDGALEELETIHSQLDPAAFLEGRVVLLAQLLGLLATFIGPSLTARLVTEI